MANDVSQTSIGFNSDNNQVTFLFGDGRQVKTPVESKQKVADQLIEIVAEEFKS